MNRNHAAALMFCLLCSPTAAQQLTVDCDRGDDLAEALRKATDSELTWIAVRGTCVGNFKIDARVSILVSGESNQTTALVSPDEGVVVDLSGPAPIVLESFEIRGGTRGVNARGPLKVVRLCDLHDNGAALFAEDGAKLHVFGSEIHDNDMALHCEGQSSCSLSLSNVAGSRFRALSVEGRSNLQVFQSQIRRNPSIGALIADGSKLLVQASLFADNHVAHIVAERRSEVELSSGTVVGVEGDATEFALAASFDTLVRTSPFEQGAAVEIRGKVLGIHNSYLALERVKIFGSLELRDFARAKIGDATITGRVVCTSGGDAACGEGVAATFDGCASARVCERGRPNEGLLERPRDPDGITTLP